MSLAILGVSTHSEKGSCFRCECSLRRCPNSDSFCRTTTLNQAHANRRTEKSLVNIVVISASKQQADTLQHPSVLAAQFFTKLRVSTVKDLSLKRNCRATPRLLLPRPSSSKISSSVSVG
jgi:hypothetical protein